MCELCKKYPEKQICQQEMFQAQIESGMVLMRMKNPENGSSEELWCEPVAKNLLKVCNNPLFNDKCSVGDIVEAEQSKSHEWLFTFHKTIEKITEAVYILFDISGMTIEQLRKKHQLFIRYCQEHELKTECPMPGYAIVAVPYGKTEEYKDVIIKNAEMVKLDMMM